MHELERRANKHFNILTDYDKRQEQLEAHAVQLLFKKNDPNLPLIPAPESAHLRRHCPTCRLSFWGLMNQHYCNQCLDLMNEEARLETELEQLEREMRMHELRDQIKKRKEEGNSLSDELARLATS